MKELTFQLEVLTPLFMGGADARRNPELRPPSVRGSARYWYRALLGGIGTHGGYNVNDLDWLKEQEADLFGSTETGAKVNLVLHPVGSPHVKQFRKEGAIPHPSGGKQPTGKDYLLWSMAESGKPGTPRHLPAREFIAPGSTYTMHVRTIHREEALIKVSSALWLLGNLGSLGSRSRRGAGSIQLDLSKSLDNHKNQLPEFRTAASIPDLIKLLEDGLKTCKQAVSPSGATWRGFGVLAPEYDTLAPDTCRIWIVTDHPNGWQTYLEALNGLGEKFRDFRSHLTQGGIGKADHDAIYQWLSDEKSVPNIQRAAFGLPLPFGYRDGQRDVIISTQGDRRSSPLHMRITRLTTGKYVGVLTLFKSRFLEVNQELKLQGKGYKAPSPASYQVVYDFVDTFPIQTEVKL